MKNRTKPLASYRILTFQISFKMRYIDTWLSGLGLDYIVPKLKANGITTPKKLATLTLREIYEVGK